jgi:hypothetical protein
MKFAIVFATLFAAAMAQNYRAPGSFRSNGPAGPKDEVLRYTNDNIGVDGYTYGFETSGGISATETGKLLNVGREDEHIAVRGSFSYQGDDGQTYTVNYVADENGFQPQGAHLPVA